MADHQQDRSSDSFVAAPRGNPSNGSCDRTEKPLELTAQNLQKAAQQLLIPSSPKHVANNNNTTSGSFSKVPPVQPQPTVASFNLYGPTNGDENAVVERYVLSEMGAVRELDDALEKAKQILEASLYQCARQSLYHIAQNREDLQRQQREFELEQLRQEFESKRIQQREEEVKKRELNLLRREEVMIKREEQLMSRDRALERIQIFAHEDLRRQRLISIANVELSEIVLEHVRRVELTAMSDAPQQYFLQTVSKYLQGYNENLKALAHSPKLDKDDDDEEVVEGKRKQKEEAEELVERQKPQSKYRRLMQQNENEHQDSAEELVVRAFHPIPPSIINQNAKSSGATFSLANVRTSRLQQQSMLFAIVETAPSFYYKIQRDYSLDICQLHIQGNRAMHVVRDVPLLNRPSIEQQQPHQRKVFQFNVLSSVSSTRNPYLIPTSSTVGHGYFDIELFDPALLKSLVLVGGDPLAMMIGAGSASPENSPTRFSPTRNLLQQSEKSREEMLRAFTSPAINFVYFAPREKKSDQQKQKQILDQMMSEEIKGMKTAPGSPEQVAKQVERDHRAHFLAHFEDSVVLVLGTVTKPKPDPPQPSQEDNSNKMAFNMRPQSAPTNRSNNNNNNTSTQKQPPKKAEKTITIHTILAKVALSSFVDDDNEQEKSSSLNFTASVDLFCKNLIVKRSAPKNKWRSSLHLQQQEAAHHRSPDAPNRNPKNDNEIDKEAVSRIESALVHSGQAESEQKIPVFSSVATFEQELASASFKSTVMSHDNVSLYLGVMITSPCGAIEFVKIEDV